MRALLLATCVVSGSALAAAPAFCAAVADAQNRKPPASLGGQGKCVSRNDKVLDCTVQGDAAKVRGLWSDAVRELSACVDVTRGLRQLKRETNEKGELTLGSLELLSGEWLVNAFFDADAPELVFTVKRVPAARPAVTPSCDDVKALLLRKTDPVLPGAKQCRWTSKPDAIQCELALDNYANVVKQLDACLPGWKRESTEKADARSTPAERIRFDGWRNDHWHIAGELKESEPSALLTLEWTAK